MLTADGKIHCWGGEFYSGRLGTGVNGGIKFSDVPLPATEFNTGSANVQIIAGHQATYVNIELLSPLKSNWYLA
jgi:hypothetical protein